MSDGEFSVSVFYTDGRHAPVERFTDAGTAVLAATCWIGLQPVGDKPERIIITDGGDHTVFEWRRGEGVTWPRPC